jgi:hypothetical protein
MVEGLRSGLARALQAPANITRRQSSTPERGAAELRERVEDIEDSLAAFEART